ncbi:hypothetical protein Clacol_008350 [Clathrus columnatus]|uniref:Uncharacterized protein n=1 Tax=Clathrus columnatus TaxID=1419009 RepID=A0AAV5ALY0_9AGAM|nr:hypothetical protein Clacol_008350 [Clathrus columnatus]
MRLENVSSQSHTVVTQTTTISENGGKLATQTNIYSIDFGGPTQTVQGEQVQDSGTISVSAVIASNTLIVEEVMINNGTTETLDLHCNVHDGNQGDCSEVIEVFNSAATMATSATFTQTLPSDGFFGPLPTGGGSSSSSQHPPTPSPSSSNSTAPAPSSSTTSNSPTQNPASPTPSTSSTALSTVSPPPSANPTSPAGTPNPASPTTPNPTPTTPSPNSPNSPTTNSSETGLPIDNSGAPSGLHHFCQW